MFNDRMILGMTLQGAKEKLAPLGLYPEQSFNNVNTIFINPSYKPERINVIVTHGIITSVLGRG